METAAHRTAPELEAGIDEIRRSPRDVGRLEMIVRRPAVDEREVLEVGELDPAHGLVGDTWGVRRTPSTSDGSPHPDKQVNLMNARAIALVAGDDRTRWAWAGDQLYVDLALGSSDVPAGSRLEIGGAVVEVTDQPHLGCTKFAARFGRDAVRLVNSPVGRELNLRGINARVVVPGTVRVGDAVRVIQNGAVAPA